MLLIGFALSLASLIGMRSPLDEGAGPQRRADVHPVRRVLPLAILAAASVFNYSLPGLLWIAAVGTVVLVARWVLVTPRPTLPEDWLRKLAPYLLGLLVVVAVATAGEWSRIADFSRLSALNPDRFGSDLGNLAQALSPLEGLGIWPAGEFDATPTSAGAPAPLFYLGALIGLAALILGLLRDRRERDWVLPALLVAMAAVYAMAALFSSPYIAAKALSIVAPVVHRDRAPRHARLPRPGAGARHRPRLRRRGVLVPRHPQRAGRPGLAREPARVVPPDRRWRARPVPRPRRFHRVGAPRLGRHHRHRHQLLRRRGCEAAIQEGGGGRGEVRRRRRLPGDPRQLPLHPRDDRRPRLRRAATVPRGQADDRLRALREHRHHRQAPHARRGYGAGCRARLHRSGSAPRREGQGHGARLEDEAGDRRAGRLAARGHRVRRRAGLDQALDPRGRALADLAGVRQPPTAPRQFPRPRPRHDGRRQSRLPRRDADVSGRGDRGRRADRRQGHASSPNGRT